MIRDGLRSGLRLTMWTACLVASARLLVATGSATLAMPVTSLDDLSRWLGQAPPGDMAMALLRLSGLAAVYYLLAVTALGVLARVLRLGGVATAVDRISPAVVRRVVTSGSGVGLVLGGLVGMLPAPGSGPGAEPSTIASAPGTPTAADPTAATLTRVSDPTATMTRVAPPTTASAMGAPGEPSGADEPGAEAMSEATMTRLDESPPPSATMTRLDPAMTTSPGPGSSVEDVAQVVYEPPVAGLATAPAPPQIDPTRWVVEPGDSLWTIAAGVVASAEGPTPGDRSVSRYWQRLVEANRTHLVDPGNPDLLVPGQHLTVPPLDG